MENNGILEIANLSLDEPELDAELFRSFNNVNDDNEVNYKFSIYFMSLFYVLFGFCNIV